MDVAIDWNSAEVTAEHGAAPLQLTVRLDSKPDSFWTSAFATLKQRHDSELRGDWWVNVPSSGTLTVGGVQTGAEDEVRAALDEMVAQANEDAKQARIDSDKKARREEEAKRERVKEAEAMTERFRRPPT